MRVLWKFGFTEERVPWINTMLSSYKASILVNSISKGLFNTSRGLR